MPRVTIQQFRAQLADRSSPGVRAYRELARRPLLVVGTRLGEWNVWTQMAAPRANG